MGPSDGSPPWLNFTITQEAFIKHKLSNLTLGFQFPGVGLASQVICWREAKLVGYTGSSWSSAAGGGERRFIQKLQSQ